MSEPKKDIVASFGLFTVILFVLGLALSFLTACAGPGQMEKPPQKQEDYCLERPDAPVCAYLSYFDEEHDSDKSSRGDKADGRKG